MPPFEIKWARRDLLLAKSTSIANPLVPCGFPVRNASWIVGAASRSVELNYENNILFHDAALTGAMLERQQDYIARSQPVDEKAVAAWPRSRRLWNNLIATLGPVL